MQNNNEIFIHNFKAWHFDWKDFIYFDFERVPLAAWNTIDVISQTKHQSTLFNVNIQNKYDKLSEIHLINDSISNLTVKWLWAHHMCQAFILIVPSIRPTALVLCTSVISWIDIDLFHGDLILVNTFLIRYRTN